MTCNINYVPFVSTNEYNASSLSLQSQNDNEPISQDISTPFNFHGDEYYPFSEDQLLEVDSASAATIAVSTAPVVAVPHSSDESGNISSLDFVGAWGVVR